MRKTIFWTFQPNFVKIRKNNGKKFIRLTDIQQVLKMWKMRNLTLEGIIGISKTITISKIVFQSFIITAPKYVINELEKIQKDFLEKMHETENPEIKHETLCNDCKAGGLKNVYIPNKIVAPQCSWIRRLCNNSLHERKLILLLRNPLAVHLNFIQIYSLKVIKASFSHLSIEK